MTQSETEKLTDRLAIDALSNVRYIVRTKLDVYEAAEYVDTLTLGMKRLAMLERRQDLVDAIDRMRIIHEAALAYATGRTYEVPR